MTPVRLLPAALRSRVKHSTTEPLTPFLVGSDPRTTYYGVYISQLIWFARASSHVADFNTDNKILTNKLFKQGYHKLHKTFSKFYCWYYDLLCMIHGKKYTMCPYEISRHHTLIKRQRPPGFRVKWWFSMRKRDLGVIFKNDTCWRDVNLNQGTWKKGVICIRGVIFTLTFQECVNFGLNQFWLCCVGFRFLV